MCSLMVLSAPAEVCLRKGRDISNCGSCIYDQMHLIGQTIMLLIRSKQCNELILIHVISHLISNGYDEVTFVAQIALTDFVKVRIAGIAEVQFVILVFKPK